jgi:hypothetical protein
MCKLIWLFHNDVITIVKLMYVMFEIKENKFEFMAQVKI